MHPLLAERRSGILLHITSLPGPYAQGIIGHDAFRFIDLLHASGCSLWQTLPLCPPHADGSPYASLSSHAINPAWISPHWLLDRKLIDQLPTAWTDPVRQTVLQQALSRLPGTDLQADFVAFRQQQDDWLADYCLFMAIREQQQQRGWMDWPSGLRLRQPDSLQQFARQHADTLERLAFAQYLVHVQWQELKTYANQRGVLLFGDLPIYVALDSADVWANPEQFQLDKQGQPCAVAGVPPDAFSATGQHWGNPLYRWASMQADGFAWWKQRLHRQQELFDLLRIDHFRGLSAYWSIPAGADTAAEGHWCPAPGAELLQALQHELPDLALIAEDLGDIDDAVIQLRDDNGLPGMNILQFAFDGHPNNPYLPHQQPRNSVTYTGTHDNATTVGWCAELSPEQHEQTCNYLACSHAQLAQTLCRTALASAAQTAILPMQDWLELGAEHRMNTPGSLGPNNWCWRFDWAWLRPEQQQHLHDWNQRYGRLQA